MDITLLKSKPSKSQNVIDMIGAMLIAGTKNHAIQSSTVAPSATIPIRATNAPKPFFANSAACLPCSCATAPAWLNCSLRACELSTGVIAATEFEASSCTSTIIFGAGAVGHCHTPPSVKDFCSPFTKSNPGLASGTLIIVPLDLPLFSVGIFSLLLWMLCIRCLHARPGASIPLSAGALFFRPESRATQYAMRKGTEKTVMAIRDSEDAPGRERDNAAITPQQRKVLDELFSVTYEELRRLASVVSRGDPSATMNPTALVNEAWLKLSKSPNLAATSRLHFKRIAARAMRQLLVEAARRRNSQKRGAGELTISFDDSFDENASSGKELLALDSALDELAKMQPRQAQMVEARFFGGLDIAETAAMLEVSEATILRDWRAAKAWLARELHRKR